MNSLILTCAGKGERTGLSYNKILYKLGDKTVLEKSFNAFYRTGLFNEFIVTVNADDYEIFSKLLPSETKLVIGGDSRTASIKNALDFVTGDITLIHDGARPFVDKQLIEAVLDAVKNYGSGIPAQPSTNTLARCSGGKITELLGKDNAYILQTPQGFLTKDIISAYKNVTNETYPDDSAVYLKYIGEPKMVKGSEKNKKLTYKEDFINNYVYGIGFDTHRLVPNRPLVLGGVTIPHTKGLLGHSDADVLTHAIMDAILSSISMRDIGYHFSDKDSQYENISSMLLLHKTLEIAENAGYQIKNVTATIMAEQPKLMDVIPKITERLAMELGVAPTSVGIAATTMEGLGFVGREEGISVYATALLVKY